MHSLPELLSHYGYAGLFGLLVLGIVGLPVPDETLLVAAGYLISKGHLHPVFTYLAALGGSICGITISYFIGRLLGETFVVKYGKWVHLTEARIRRIDRWFHHFGHWLLAFGYYIPGVRHFTAFVAGMSGLEYPSFAVFAYAGAALWAGSFLALGYFVGENWEVAVTAVHRYLLVICIALALFGVLFWWWRSRRRKHG